MHKFQHFDRLPHLHSQFQHFDWLLSFHSSFNILINLIISSQISAFWLILNSVFKCQCFHWYPLSLKFGHFDQSPLFTQISTFWSTWHFALKFQRSDQFLIFQSNSNILIGFHFCSKISTLDQSPVFCSNFNSLIDLTFGTQISRFWSIPTLKYQHFDWLIAFSLKFLHFYRLDILHSNFNILINSQRCPQISIIWSIPNQTATFWSISNFAVKYQHLINLPFFA